MGQQAMELGQFIGGSACGRRPWRRCAGQRWTVAALLSAATLLVASLSPADDSPAREDAGAPAAERRLREGSVVEASGRFALSKDRLIFLPVEGGAPLTVLENLAAERVVAYLEPGHDERNERQWSVRGRVTEFHGGNYLLLDYALVSSRVRSSPPIPAPDQAAAS